eukprot:TRINITY_DN61231_c0_g1_i1.p1 TRINITY_DN61231_c0_g1~~TRINITY_DN61231_c0_g1_i1.p1  ORF type:complete len:815 (-),score=34.15 TRINITY_DN61231_c0_g1_i1:1592-4036(-)
MVDSEASATLCLANAVGSRPRSREATSPSPRATLKLKPEPEDSTILQTFEDVRFTIPYKIMVAAAPEDRMEIQDIIDRGFGEVDSLFNNFNELSEISIINKLPKGEQWPVSRQMLEMLTFIDELYRCTDHLFDPTVFPLATYWKEQLDCGVDLGDEATSSTSHAATLSQLQQLVGWDNLVVCDGYVSKKHDDVSIDLGGVAKGWLVDMLVQSLNESNYLDVYVDWGSDIRATGSHPAKRPWVAGLAQPPALNTLFQSWRQRRASVVDQYLVTIPLQNTALATSGDYRQVKKFGYHHIFNPITKCPLKASVDAVSSASIKCSSCMLADALATIAMLKAEPSAFQDWFQKNEKTLAKRSKIENYLLYTRNSDDIVLLREENAEMDEDTATRHTISSVGEGVNRHLMRDIWRNTPHYLTLVTVVSPTGGMGISGDADRPVTPGTLKRDAHGIVCSTAVPIFNYNNGQLSSFTDSNTSGATYFMFNLIKSSLMYTMVLPTEGKAEQRTICCHVLKENEQKYGPMFAKDPRALRRLKTTHTQKHSTVVIDDLKHTAYHCKVESLYDSGDHVIVVACVLQGPASNPEGAPPTEQSLLGPLLYSNRTYYRALLPPKEPDSPPRPLARDPLPSCVITTDSNGANAVVGFHPCGCSFSPPKLSFVAAASKRACAMFEPRITSASTRPTPPPVCRVHIVGSDLFHMLLAFNIESDSTMAQMQFAYLPTYPKIELPGALAVFDCTVDHVVYLPQSTGMMFVVAAITKVTQFKSGTPLVLHLDEQCILEELQPPPATDERGDETNSNSTTSTTNTSNNESNSSNNP